MLAKMSAKNHGSRQKKSTAQTVPVAFDHPPMPNQAHYLSPPHFSHETSASLTIIQKRTHSGV
jgi:hypothetical protein